MEFCTKLLCRVIEAQLQFLSNLIMSDDAHSHPAGYVNKQNFRFWDKKTCFYCNEHPLHIEKVTLWHAVSSFGIFRLYFFQDNNGRAVMVTSERYVTVLSNFLLPLLKKHNADLRSF